jgi:hypothetical protein
MVLRELPQVSLLAAARREAGQALDAVAREV